MTTRFAVLVVDRDGENLYLRNSCDDVVIFHSRRKADEAAEFWRDGLGDEAQSVNVVRVPIPTRRQASGISSRKPAEGL